MSRVAGQQAQDYIQLLSRHSTIPNWAFQALGVDVSTKEFIYALRMPITDRWETFRISEKAVRSNTLPTGVNEKLDYWVSMRKLLEHMRDYAPMTGDLNPITPDEKTIFGVRVNHPNPCFPTEREKQIRRFRQYNEMPSWY